MTTLTLVPPTAVCPAWCTDHDHELAVCSTGPVRLEFDGDPRRLTTDATVILAASDDGTNIHIGLGGPGYGLTVTAAQQLAYAILAKVAAAQAGGVR
jgi:hypothetical protein